VDNQFVSTPTVTELVAEKLRDELRQGVHPAGARLVQQEVANRLGVSTTPVREAVAILQREGLLYTVARRGAVVPTVTSRDVEEVYEMRIALEALAIRKAVPNLSDVDLTSIEGFLERWATAFRGGDYKAARELNEAFHARIYQASARPRLSALVGHLRESTRAFVNLLSERREHVLDTEDEHRAIFAACKSRQPDEAAGAIRAHLEHSMEIALRALNHPSPNKGT